MRIAALLLVGLGSISLVGCDVGSSGNGGGGVDPIPPGGEEIELACEASLVITGTFSPAGTPPAEGCVHDGRWSLQVAVEDDGGCPTVPVNSLYEYDVATVENDEGRVINITYLGTDGGPDDNLRAATAGSTCRLNLQHHGPDGEGAEAVYLQAFLDGTSLTGSGSYELYQ
jgi:hypothetical protein